MFVTRLPSKEQKTKTTFFGIVNLKEKTAAEIIDVVKSFLQQNI